VTGEYGPSPHRYRVGQRVRVRDDSPGGNPRTPPYVRGKTGTIIALHGQIPNPLDHRDRYPPLCTVRFELQELTDRLSRDYVTADLHEDWLEPAHPPP
jgi:nitrile hydratase subunit beta